MATSSLLEELKRLAAGTGSQQPAAPVSPFPAAPQAPTVGPTLANEAAPPQGTQFPTLAAQGQAGAAEFGGLDEFGRTPDEVRRLQQRINLTAPTESTVQPNIAARAFEGAGNAVGGVEFSEGSLPDLAVRGGEAITGGVSSAVGAIPGIANTGVKAFEGASEFLTGQEVSPIIRFGEEAPAAAEAPPAGGLEAPATGQVAPPSILSPQATEVAPAAPQAPLGGIEQVAPPAISAGQQALQDAGEAAGTRARADGTFAETRTGTARGPSSRDRAAGELSMADAVDLAGGDREKARALVVESRQPKVDTRTPEKVASDEAKAEGDRLENERKQQIIDQGNQPNATGFQKKQGEWEERKKDLEAEGMSEKEIAARRRAFLHGDTFDPFEFENTGGDVDSTEGSTSDAGSTPAASTPTEFTAGTQRKQGGKVYEFDGSKWNEVK